MKLRFTDSSLVLMYLQIKLKEQYNPNILTTGAYYTTVSNNYGFAHFIARYLNNMYPPLMASSTNPRGYDIDDAYNPDPNINPDSAFNTTRELTDTISIANYFLCDNRGGKLVLNTDEDITTTYTQLYGSDICGIFNVLDSPLFMNMTDVSNLDSDSTVALMRKIRAFGVADDIDNIARKDRIYYMPTWDIDKEICELDNLVISYLLGRTITPNSSAEDIYYVQQLFYGNYIPEMCKGVWASDYGNLTDTIKEYQRLRTNTKNTNPMFVTGYFDIFTEASILRDRGEQTYGIHGL